MIIDPSNALAAPGSSRGYARLSVAEGSIAASAIRPPPGVRAPLRRASAAGLGVRVFRGERRLRRGWGSRADAPPSSQVQTPDGVRPSAPTSPASRLSGGSEGSPSVPLPRRSRPGTPPPRALAGGRAASPPLPGCAGGRRRPRRRGGPRLPEPGARRPGRSASFPRAAVCGVPVAARAREARPALPPGARSAVLFPAGPRGRSAPGHARLGAAAARRRGGDRPVPSPRRPRRAPSPSPLGPRPQIGRGDPLNLSILVSGGKETNQDSLSNGE